jgi:hypothetical protein
MPTIIRSAANATAGTVTTVWPIWTGSTATSITTGTGQVITWRAWVTSATTTVCTTDRITVEQAWEAWQYEVDRHYVEPARRPVAPRITEEQRRLNAERDRLWQKQVDEERALRVEAERKAEILLRSILNPEQKEDLEKKRCFFLYSKGKKYRIDRGQTGNVKLLDECNEVVESYCIHPGLKVPDADAMAAQKLWLETDPDTFKRVANITHRNGGFVSGRGFAGAVG